MSDFRQLKAIPQEHPMGCAVACVASRCGLSYREALAAFSRRDFAWTRGYYCPEIVAALRKNGHEYAYVEYDPDLHTRFLKRPGTIAFVGRCKAYPSGHFVLRTESGWMNPWLNFPQMVPVECGFEKRLAGKVTYVVFEVTAVEKHRINAASEDF